MENLKTTTKVTLLIMLIVLIISGVSGEQQGDEASGKQENEDGYCWMKIAGGAVLGAAVLVAVPAYVLPLLGFTAGGITVNTFAASWMSSAAIANGGGVASASAGGVIATLQSWAVIGIPATAKAVLAAIGAAGGVVINAYNCFGQECKDD